MNKVLIIHDSFFFEDSNGNYYSIHINMEIVERYLHLGDQITFIGRKKTMKSDSLVGRISQVNNENCSVIGLPEFKTVKGYLKNFRDVKTKLEALVKDHDIIMPRVPSILGSLVVRMAKKESKPLLGEVVSCNWDALWNYGIRGKIIAPYYFLKQKMVVRKMPYAIYVTERFLQNRYPNRGISTYCSNVFIDKTPNEVLKMRLDRISKLKGSDKIVLGTVAAIDVPYKGQKYVIRSLSRIQNYNLVYHIVGSGDPEMLKEESKRRNVEKEVKILGPMKNSEIPVFLDSIDIYVQPSKQEGLPRALIEAMSRGLPCIGSRTGGIPELLPEEYIFDKGNVNQLTNILRNFSFAKMAVESKRNFSFAKNYYAEHLNRRRYEFYKNFLEKNNLPLSKKLLNELE